MGNEPRDREVGMSTAVIIVIVAVVVILLVAALVALPRMRERSRIRARERRLDDLLQRIFRARPLGAAVAIPALKGAAAQQSLARHDLDLVVAFRAIDEG